MDITAFAHHALRNPRLSGADAARLAADVFGCVGTTVELGSHQDQNFLIDDPTRPRVLKVANASFTRDELDLQNQAMLHVAASRPSFAVPAPQPARDGRLIALVDHDGTTYQLRLVDYLDGVTLAEFGYLAAPTLAAAGAVAGEVVTILHGFDHAAAERVLQWDPRRAEAVVAGLAAYVADPAQRALLEQTTARATAALAAVADALPRQVAHCDVSDWNLIAHRGADGRPLISALIDFGDTTRTYRVCELAVAAASLLPHAAERDALAVLAEVIRGYATTAQMDEAELAALAPLIAMRGAVLAAGSEQQVVLEPDNAYARRVANGDWTILQAVARIPFVVAEAAFRAALGRGPSRAVRQMRAALSRPATPIVALLDGDPQPVALDADAESYDATDATNATAITPRIATAAGVGHGYGYHGEARLLHTRVPSRGQPATIHLGTDIFVPASTAVRAPYHGRVRRVTSHGMVIDHGAFATRLAGLVPRITTASTVEPGALVGEVAAAPDGAPLPAHLHVQVLCAGVDDAPGSVAPAVAAPWLAVCPDPAALLGLSGTGVPRHDAAGLREARRRSIASPQRLYYRDPPPIIRGRGAYLYDADARGYVDCVNNVAILGHAHPAVTAAATRQLRRVNTNSRFLQPSIVRFAELLAGLVPDPLQVVFLVSSGSEANDLALRIARGVTGAQHVVCLDGAYHGWTDATFAVSTSLADNPHARDRRDPRVHTVPAPDTYRGPHTTDDAAARYAAYVAGAIAQITSSGGSVAGFIAEPVLGNSGGLIAPAGYLDAVYGMIRAAGGLCIADEVQVGYGRLGTHFWGFEQQAVVPDMVTIAKATGNGYPLAAVITTRQIADAFANEGAFFASVGGGTVACEVGCAVLDVLATERLQQHALEVGARFRSGLESLLERHELVGAVHGVGLYLGLDLVADRAMRTPATATAYAVCERLRELGVIVQPTGEHENILKLKPPLVISASDCDFVVSTLDDVLEHGW